MPANVPADDIGAPSEGSEACAYTTYDHDSVPEAYPKTGENATGAEADVWTALYEVQDPEMPVSIVDLGLIYNVDVSGGSCDIEMTLTYTGCPARDIILNDVRCAAETAPKVDQANVRLKYTPGWSVEMVTEEGKEALRDFGLSV